jgi:transcription initiation factor TFIIH subunit 3
VFSVSEDIASQYIPVNNCVFSAANRGFMIDACVLGPTPSIFLQQAAQQTGGQYCTPTISQHSSLLEYFIGLLLPHAALRRILLLPPAKAVTLRAHCFCHKEFRSMGFLCPTCLAVWCKDFLTCPCCGTTAGSLIGA